MSKKLLSMIVVVVLSSGAFASAVAWNVVYTGHADWSGWGGPESANEIGINYHGAYCCFWTENFFDYYSISFRAYEFTLNMGGINAIVAQEGDVISSENTTGRENNYFYGSGNELGGEVIIDDEGWYVMRNSDRIFYLGFSVDADDGKKYGWAEFQMGTDGRLEVLQSALGLDGQAMVVGAIPEPSSALLLLVGLAGLVLRRRGA